MQKLVSFFRFAFVVLLMAGMALLPGCGSGNPGDAGAPGEAGSAISATLQVNAGGLPVFDATEQKAGTLEKDTLLTIDLHEPTVIDSLLTTDLEVVARPEILLARNADLGWITARVLHDVQLPEGSITAGTNLRISFDPEAEESRFAIAGFAGDDAARVAALNARLFRATQLQTRDEADADPMDALSLEELEDAFLIGTGEPDGADEIQHNSTYYAPVCKCLSGACRISSKYGPRTSSVTTNGSRMSSFHRGLDVSDYGRAGAPIIAAKAGCVARILTNRTSGYGLTVFLKHSDGVQTQYSHMSRFVRTTGCATRGSKLGYMGSTGNVTGPHLHLGTLVNSGYVNPEIYFSLTRIISGSRLACR